MNKHGKSSFVLGSLMATILAVPGIAWADGGRYDDGGHYDNDWNRGGYGWNGYYPGYHGHYGGYYAPYYRGYYPHYYPRYYPYHPPCGTGTQGSHHHNNHDHWW
jgi:hypothetical protein